MQSVQSSSSDWSACISGLKLFSAPKHIFKKNRNTQRLVECCVLRMYSFVKSGLLRALWSQPQTKLPSTHSLSLSPLNWALSMMLMDTEVLLGQLRAFDGQQHQCYLVLLVSDTNSPKHPVFNLFPRMAHCQGSPSVLTIDSARCTVSGWLTSLSCWINKWSSPKPPTSYLKTICSIPMCYRTMDENCSSKNYHRDLPTSFLLLEFFFLFWFVRVNQIGLSPSRMKKLWRNVLRIIVKELRKKSWGIRHWRCMQKKSYTSK